MALKSEFDHRSYWIVLFRTLTGAILGTLPGLIYVLSVGGKKIVEPFAWDLIQLGSIVGTLAFGFAALGATIVAAQKGRGSGPKPTRLKDYTHPHTLPAIPPASKPENLPGTRDTEVKVTPVETPLGQERMHQPVNEIQPGAGAEQQSFEDFDRQP